MKPKLKAPTNIKEFHEWVAAVKLADQQAHEPGELFDPSSWGEPVAMHWSGKEVGDALFRYSTNLHTTYHGDVSFLEEFSISGLLPYKDDEDRTNTNCLITIENDVEFSTPVTIRCSLRREEDGWHVTSAEISGGRPKRGRGHVAYKNQPIPNGFSDDLLPLVRQMLIHKGLWQRLVAFHKS